MFLNRQFLLTTTTMAMVIVIMTGMMHAGLTGDDRCGDDNKAQDEDRDDGARSADI